jgi:hypothetical protein
MPTATTPNTTAQHPAGVTKHVNDKGMEAALGIGRGGKRLNTHCQDLQERIDDIRDEFLEVRSIYIGRERHDVLRNGLLGEIVSRTPILVYDLPELKAECSTAFVDRSGKMYICDTFARRLLAEHDAGYDSLNFIIRHEADHLRRLHLQRMLDLPGMLANIAQDIRINIDNTKAESADRFYEATGRNTEPNEQIEAVRKYLAEHAHTTIAGLYAMRIDDYLKYDGMSEEAIGALLLQDWKEPPAQPNREVSFMHIMEGAAQEADGVKGMLLSGKKLAPTPPIYAMTPADLSGLAQDLRKVGQTKANPALVTNKDLQDCYDRLAKLREHQGLVELDMCHAKGAMGMAGSGSSYTSGKTGDAYLDAMAPSQRVETAMRVLEKILTPSANNGIPGAPQSGVLTIKDLDRIFNGIGGGMPSGPMDQSSKGDHTLVPPPNVFHDHIMDTEDLVDLLNKAGVNNQSLQKLGYDDLDKLADEHQACKDGVVSSINKASEDMMRVGSRYPGGHLVNYAKAQMLDFFKPVLTWEMAYKKLLESMGKGQRNAPEEAWTGYYVDAADMGFRHQREVPYLGSTLPGKEKTPLLLGLHDTSGSVDDAMLKRFVSEGINMSRKMSRGTAPDVVHIFADTVARGKPVYITEKNYKEFLSKGINYGGRGGTNFQASIENAFELVKPGPRTTERPYAGREINALAYFTDTGDAAPDFARLLKKAQECGMKKLPTILFIAPKSCFNDAFNKTVSKYATVVYFESGPKATAKTNINLDEIAQQQERKTRGLKAA